MYICLCYAVTEEEIKQRIEQGADFIQVQQELRVGTCCGCCQDDVGRCFSNPGTKRCLEKAA